MISDVPKEGIEKQKYKKGMYPFFDEVIKPELAIESGINTKYVTGFEKTRLSGMF